MLTAKHSLCQMLGRTEGCLLQDMPLERVRMQITSLKTFYHFLFLNSVEAKRGIV